MDPRYKRKAIVELIVWIIALPLAFLVLALGYALQRSHMDHLSSAMFVLCAFFVVAWYVAFFRGRGDLARAKGYSAAVAIPGIFPPAQPFMIVLLLFALPDKCPTSSDS